LDAVYYDTPDLRLARWGASVRYRAGDGTGWTVKLADGDEGAALVRRELTFQGKLSSTVPADVANLVRAYARSAALVPAARLRTRRRGVELLDAEGLRLAEVVDDEVSVYEGRRLASRFRELEVELEAGASTSLLHAVIEALHRAGAGAVEPIPKVVRALGARASERAELVEEKPDDDSTAGDVVRAAIAASVIRILRHDAGVRIGDDAEDVHQARVGARRLRSDLQTFESLLDPGWLGALVGELRWLGSALGAVRDADVLLDRLRRQAASLPQADAAGAATLVRRLVQQREVARADLLQAMAGPRYLELLDRLVAAAQAPALLPEADGKAAEVLPALVLRPWKKLARAVKELDDPPPDEQLHAVRIRAKRCRYAVEAVASVVGKEAKRMGSAVAGLQGVLGDHQDAVVAEGWLREAARSAGVSKLVAGELIALQRVEAEECRQAWWAAWREARDPKLRKWLS
ncbi:MAG TPA: CYTH and CHAD domain-containing protein, partial [Acidimicrobiales bacterium]|nr:CYTH and CHAD domain-containing protein [Acidimicrobiales bacterium]